MPFLRTAARRRTSPSAILALVLLVQAVATMGPLGMPAIAPMIRDALDLSLPQAGSFLSAFHAAPIVMSLAAGPIADRFGLGFSIVLGQALIAFGFAGASLSSSFPVLIAMVALGGVGFGLLNPATTTAVIRWFPPAQRATVVGVKQVGLPLGGALGALLLPPVALLVGWRLALAASAAAIVLATACTLLIYRDPPAPERPAGTASAPRRSVFRDRDIWCVAISSLVFAGVQTVWMGYLVLYLRDIGVGMALAAALLGQAQIAGVVARLVFGVLSDRLFGGRRRIVLVLAACGSMLCTLGLACTGDNSSAAWLSALVLGFGFFGIGWNGVQHALIAELAGPANAATAIGLGLATSSFGVVVLPPIFGWAVDWTGTYRDAWLGLGLFMAIALAALAAVRERGASASAAAA
ncbi:MAG: MFS transporter [Candidatus Binatia bacterium]